MSSIPLSLYVHLPWCIRKCPYCDFNSHPTEGGMDEGAYVQALLRDLAFDRVSHEAFIADRKVSTVFFGGGTPSLFSAQAIGTILTAIDQQLGLAEDAEITLEANPGSSEQSRFAGYRAAGVNRLSIGVQSFDEEKLRVLGRVHDRQEAVQAAQAARAAGFENFNLDLMYALPQQTLKAAASDLAQAIAMAPSHISYYQLTMEPGTHFYLHPPKLPDDELAWEMQLQGEALLAAAGYGQYEVSAYARSGQPCRHNLNYWQYGDYLGVGAGAHGKLTDLVSGRILRTAKQRIPGKYMRAAGEAEAVTACHDVLAGDRAFEFLLNAFRLRGGFSLQQFAVRSGLGLPDIRRVLAPAQSQGLLTIDAERAVMTDEGWRHIDGILAGLLPEAGENRPVGQEYLK